MPSPSPFTSSRRALAVAFAAALAACGESSPPAPPPLLLQQPEAAIRFAGQTALFQVRASGSALTYQWSRDGAAIPGAVDSHYLTPPLGPLDDGAVYQVAVFASGSGPAVSQAARLRVYPPLDLRFQWVGSPLQLAVGVGSNILFGTIHTWGGVGAPLLVGDGNCAPGSSAMSCSWYYYVDPTVPGFHTRYESRPLAAFDAAWLAANAPGSLVTTLDLQESAGAFAASVLESTQTGTFTPVLGTAAPADLPAVAAAEGAAGRVITAVSHRAGLVSWISHAWSEAPGARYETSVAATTVAGAGAAATGLAAQGYVVTALGAGNGGADGVVLVGTRREGETAPREVVVQVLTAGPRIPPGHAPVGFLFDAATATWTVIYER